jgi:hypothetical protein
VRTGPVRTDPVRTDPVMTGQAVGPASDPMEKTVVEREPAKGETA